MNTKSIFAALFCALSLGLVQLAAAAAPDHPVLAVPHKALSCETCHAAAAPTMPPANQACLACHGTPEALIEKTGRYDLNPHNSPHWGPDVACGTCHRQHQPPRDYCSSCHTKVPYRLK